MESSAHGGIKRAQEVHLTLYTREDRSTQSSLCWSKIPGLTQSHSLGLFSSDVNFDCVILEGPRADFNVFWCVLKSKVCSLRT